MSVRSRLLSMIGALIIAVVAAPPAYGQRRSAVPDEQIIREAQLVASGARVDLFQHGLVADPALVDAAVRALLDRARRYGHLLEALRGQGTRERVHAIVRSKPQRAGAGRHELTA